ncbi:hypothetical protein D3C73_956020 [compost metagenome]
MSEESAHWRQCATRVESEPAEPQNDYTEYSEHLVVAWNNNRFALFIELAETRLKQDGRDYCRRCTCKMDYSGTCIILHAQFSQPAAAPYPVSYYRVDYNGEQNSEDDIYAKLSAFSHTTGYDGQGNRCKSHLEQEFNIECYIGETKSVVEGGSLCVSAIPEARSSEEAVPVTEAKTEAQGPETQTCNSQCQNCLTGNVSGVLHPDGSGFKHCKPCLHKEYKNKCQESKSRIQADLQIRCCRTISSKGADRVNHQGDHGQEHHQHLFLHLNPTPQCHIF